MAKNDRREARILARFGEAIRPVNGGTSERREYQVLSPTLSHHRQIVAMLTVDGKRRGRAILDVRNRVQVHITWLEEELKDLDDELRGIVQSSPVRRKEEVLL